MNVLVTGATGFLGPHLCRGLVAEGHTITVLHRATSDLSSLNEFKPRYLAGEITDAASVDCATTGQDAVIHAASVLRSARGQTSLLYEVNVNGTKNVVRACLRNRVRRLLHVSSVAAIGIPEESAKPANENFVFNLSSSKLHYHISKHEAEGVVREGIDRGLDAVIVNPTGLYGPARSFYRGGDIIRQVKQTRLLRYPSGGACVVHVQDVVDGLISALHRGITGNRYILGGENLTFREIMEKTALALRLKRTYFPIPGAATRTLAALSASWSAIRGHDASAAYANYYSASRWSYYDSSKARHALGFNPRTFELILEEAIRFVG